MNERQKAIEKLEKDLIKSANSKRFVESTEGSYVLSYISELISGLTNQVLNTRRSHEEYVELRAQIDILRKLKQVLEVQADDKVILALREKLDLAQSGE